MRGFQWLSQWDGFQGFLGAFFETNPFTFVVIYDYNKSMTRIYLKEWRRALGMSVRALEARSGISLASIVRVEAGRQDPTVSLLEKLARAMGAEVVDLFRTPEKREMEQQSRPKTRKPGAGKTRKPNAAKNSKGSMSKNPKRRVREDRSRKKL